MSKKFVMVKNFYDKKLWTKGMVKNAVDRWITVEEYQTITGEKYQK